MQVELSLAELLINAIAHGRVPGVQFKRGWSDERATFTGLQAVIGDRLDGARRVAIEQALEEARKGQSVFKLRAENERLQKRVEQLEAELDAATTRGRELVQEAEERAERAEAEVARLRDEVFALKQIAKPNTLREVEAENARLRAAVEEAVAVIGLCTTRRFDAPEDPEVGRLCRRLGYGAVMSAASKEWAKMFDGTPQAGAQHTSGPCESTVLRTLEMLRASRGESVTPTGRNHDALGDGTEGGGNKE